LDKGDATYVTQPPCTNAPQCVAMLKATKQGESTARVRYAANGSTDTQVAKATFVDLKIEITELSFEQDLTVLNDVGRTPTSAGKVFLVEDPVWKKSEPMKIGPVA